MSSNDITVLRDLAKRYADIAALPLQDENMYHRLSLA